MKAPTFMATGSFLFVFGLLWLLFSSAIINEIYSYYADQIAIAYSQLIGLILAALGAGLFTYGHATNSKIPESADRVIDH